MERAPFEVVLISSDGAEEPPISTSEETSIWHNLGQLSDFKSGNLDLETREIGGLVGLAADPPLELNSDIVQCSIAGERTLESAHFAVEDDEETVDRQSSEHGKHDPMDEDDDEFDLPSLRKPAEKEQTPEPDLVAAQPAPKVISRPAPRQALPDSDSDEELPDMNAIFNRAKEFEEEAGTRRESVRSTRNLDPLYTGFPTAPTESGSAMASSSTTRETSRSGFTLAGLVKEKRERAERIETIQAYQEQIRAGTMVQQQQVVSGRSGNSSDADEDLDMEEEDSPFNADSFLYSASVFRNRHLVNKPPSVVLKLDPPNRLCVRSQFSVLGDRVAMRRKRQRRAQQQQQNSYASPSTLPKSFTEPILEYCQDVSLPTDGAARRLAALQTICAVLQNSESLVDLKEALKRFREVLAALGFRGGETITSGSIPKSTGGGGPGERTRPKIDPLLGNVLFFAAKVLCNQVEKLKRSEIGMELITDALVPLLVATFDQALGPAYMLQLSSLIDRLATKLCSFGTACSSLSPSWTPEIADKAVDELRAKLADLRAMQAAVLRFGSTPATRAISRAFARSILLSDSTGEQGGEEAEPTHPQGSLQDTLARSYKAILSISRKPNPPSEEEQATMGKNAILHAVTDFGKLAIATEILGFALGRPDELRGKTGDGGKLAVDLKQRLFAKIQDQRGQHLDRTMAKHNLLTIQIWLNYSTGRNEMADDDEDSGKTRQVQTRMEQFFTARPSPAVTEEAAEQTVTEEAATAEAWMEE